MKEKKINERRKQIYGTALHVLEWDMKKVKEIENIAGNQQRKQRANKCQRTELKFTGRQKRNGTRNFKSNKKHILCVIRTKLT